MINMEGFEAFKEKYRATLKNPEKISKAKFEERALKMYANTPESKAEPTKVSKKKFKDVIGHDEEKELLLELASYWKYETKYKKPKGIMFYGYPGCGKSVLAEALAGEIDETQVYMRSITNSDITGYVGTTEKKIHDFFLQVHEEAGDRQIILVMDEADQMIPSKDKGLNDIVGERVSGMLREFDGYMDNNDKVIFILTTNHPKKIESAFLRSGRVGFKIQVMTPTPEERYKLIDMYLGHIKGIDEKVKEITFRLTEKWTGADYEQFSGILEVFYKSKLEEDPNYTLTALDISKKLDFVIRHTKKNFKLFEEEYENYREQDE